MVTNEIQIWGKDRVAPYTGEFALAFSTQPHLNSVSSQSEYLIEKGSLFQRCAAAKQPKQELTKSIFSSDVARLNLIEPKHVEQLEPCVSWWSLVE